MTDKELEEYRKYYLDIWGVELEDIKFDIENDIMQVYIKPIKSIEYIDISFTVSGTT